MFGPHTLLVYIAQMLFRSGFTYCPVRTLVQNPCCLCSHRQKLVFHVQRKLSSVLSQTACHTRVILCSDERGSICHWIRRIPTQLLSLSSLELFYWKRKRWKKMLQVPWPRSRSTQRWLTRWRPACRCRRSFWMTSSWWRWPLWKRQTRDRTTSLISCGATSVSLRI